MNGYGRILAIAIGLAASGLGGCQTSVTAGHGPPTLSKLSTGDAGRTRDLYLSVIDQLIQSGKSHAAMAHLDEFEIAYGVVPQSLKLRADAWLALDNPGEAKKGYDAIVTGPLSGFGYHGLGRVAAVGGDWQKALEYFEIAVVDQPTNTRFLNDLGCAQFQTGDFASAEFSLRKALELSPGDPEVRDNIVVLLAKSGETGRFSEIFPDLTDAAQIESLKARMAMYAVDDD